MSNVYQSCSLIKFSHGIIWCRLSHLCRRSSVRYVLYLYSSAGVIHLVTEWEIYIVGTRFGGHALAWLVLKQYSYRSGHFLLALVWVTLLLLLLPSILVVWPAGVQVESWSCSSSLATWGHGSLNSMLCEFTPVQHCITSGFTQLEVCTQYSGSSLIVQQ